MKEIMLNEKDLENIREVSAIITRAKGCKCSYCVEPDKVHYNPEYCYVVKMIKTFVGEDWWDNIFKRFVGYGRFDVLNPMINGKIVEHKVVPVLEKSI